MYATLIELFTNRNSYVCVKVVPLNILVFILLEARDLLGVVVHTISKHDHQISHKDRPLAMVINTVDVDV